MSKPDIVVLIRDNDQLLEGLSDQVPLIAENKDEALKAAGQRLVFAMNDAKAATSHDNAIRNLAEIAQLIDTLDMLLDREISKSRVMLNKTFGGYDKLLTIVRK